MTRKTLSHRRSTKGRERFVKWRNYKRRSLIPNMITVTALCAGLSGIRFALHGKWELAVTAILIAAVLDSMDGRVARFLDSTSEFGAELDSLADFVNFGVGPSLIMYLHSLHQWGNVGWAPCLFFTICSALRLARFNTIREEQSPWSDNFFVGLPTTAAALLVLIPLMIEFMFQHPWEQVKFFNFFALTFIGLLMISRLPIISFKGIRVPPQWIVPTLVSVALLGASLVNAPWHTALILGAAYMFAIPIGIFKAYRPQEQTHTPDA